jgi:hypothetical protein
MRFIFRSDTLGVFGCVLVMCLRCLWLLHVHVIHYGLNSIYMMHAEIRNNNRPIICIMKLKQGNTMKFWKYRR